MRRALSTVLAGIVGICLVPPLAAAGPKRPARMKMEATAHSVKGETAQGTQSRAGTVAADPAVLPLGSKIRVLGAGGYSGEYTVADTGPKVDGRHIDIYMKSDAEAKKFGKKTVTVTVLKYGDNKRKVTQVIPRRPSPGRD